ncbi:hypothetical protein niasHT_029841 [Heterodera trifolii]|uniref:SSD domain-containing protein n=1 Tax=Heterodera trifolii TaxID=157864 RepID=A0ABD2K0R5_9BILA
MSTTDRVRPVSPSENGTAVTMRQRRSTLARQGSMIGGGFPERRRSSILVGQRSMDLQMEQTGNVGPRFVLFIIRMYRRWGRFVAKHDWKAMLLCLITSLIGFIVVMLTPQQNDIQGYAPPNARARIEYSRFQDFFSRDGPGISVYIFLIAKDDGSMLREAYMNETLKVLDMATDDVKLYYKNERGDFNQSFSKFCRSFCKANQPFRAFQSGFIFQNGLVKNGQKLSSRINLDYPIARVLQRPFSLQQTFFGINFFNESTTAGIDPSDQRQFNLTAALLNAAQSSAAENGTTDGGGILDEVMLDEGTANGRAGDGANLTSDATKLALARGADDQPNWQQHVTNMREVKMVMLRFDAEHQPNWTVAMVKQYELAMRDRFQREYKSDRIALYVLSKSVIEDEMIRAGLSIIPYMSIGFAVMVICSVFCVYMRALYMHQHSAPKIFLAIAACVLPFMSSATALGFMFMFGFRFSSILCLIPILVLSIGVDSSYLMIHEWQAVIQHCRRQPSRTNNQVDYRISQVLSEIGPAVLISTLTNIFADGCGWYTSSPELGALCLGNMVSMLVAFIYQMTFYAGLMSLVGRYEIATERRERRELQESIRRAVETGGAGMELGKSSVKHGLTRQHSKFHEHTKHYISESIQTYVSIVANKFVAMLIVVLYFVYLGMSIWGVTQMEVKLSIQQLFTSDSPLLKVDELRVGYQVPHFMSSTVLVFNPGNLSDPERLAKMNKFVAELEAINGSWGPIGTKYFVRDFIAYELRDEDDLESELAALDAGVESTTSAAGGGGDDTAMALTTQTPNGPFREEDLRAFLRWPESEEWKAYIRLDNDTGRLERFFFTTGYHGDQLKIWTERGHMLNQWRAIVDKYAKSENFNASVYYDDSIFLDLIDNMPIDTLQSVIGTLLCMGFVCFLFLNSMFTVAMASGCVLSICCGILGILSWLKTDLDPITMAAMTISIGFSVDIPAHVSYHYYQAAAQGVDQPQAKLVNCLSSVAFPALQAALSTSLCVSSLLLVHLHMATVFVRTMVLCVVLCNLHGLVFLPAFLILFDSVVQHMRKRAAQRRAAGAATDANGGGGAVNKRWPTPIPEANSSQESSLRAGTAPMSPPAQHRNGAGGQYRNGRTKAPAEQSRVTDRPMLERFNSVDETDGGGTEMVASKPSMKSIVKVPATEVVPENEEEQKVDDNNKSATTDKQKQSAAEN